VNTNWPMLVWQWDPAYGAADTTRRWYSLTSRVGGYDGDTVSSSSYGRQYELATIETGVASVQVDNLDELLTPGNLASPYQVMAGWQYRQSSGARSSTGAGPYSIQFDSRTLPGSLIVIVTIGTTAVTVTPIPGSASFTSMATVTAASHTMTMWGAITRNGGDHYIVMEGSGVFTGFALEYIGTGTLDNLDVTATASVTSGSYTSASTGTTTAATAGDLSIVAVAPCDWAAASSPTGPSWASATSRGASLATASATASENSIVFVGDSFPTTAVAQSDTATWTNTSVSALGMVVTIKQSPTVDMIAPPAGSQAVIPYRPIRQWAMWPSSTTGNLLNSTNNQWAELGSVVGSYSDTAGFGTSTGTWWVDSAASIADTTTRAHDGSHSMLVTWPTAASGAAYVSTDLPPSETGYQYTFSAWVWVPTGSPAVLLQWGLTNGTASSTNDAWERITVTVTRADGQDDRLYLATNASSTSGDTVYVDSVMMEIASSASNYQTAGSTIYPLHTGFIERYPEIWDGNGYRGWQQLTSVDALALESSVQLEGGLLEDILQDDPAFFMPMNADPQVSTTVGRDLSDVIEVRSGDNIQAANFLNPPELLAQYYYGATSGTLTTGATGGPGLDGAKCTSWTGAGAPWIFFQPNGGGYIYIPPGNISNSYNDGTVLEDTGTGISMEVWFNTSSDLNDFFHALGATYDYTFSLTSGEVVVVETPFPSGTATTMTGHGQWADGAWHQVVLTTYASGGTVYSILYVDGMAVTTGSYAGSVAAPVDTFIIGLDVGGPTKLALIAGYPTALSAERVRSHYLASIGYPWDTGGSRISRYLGWAPWTAPTNIPTGITRVGSTAGQAGSAVLDLINTATATEAGGFVCERTGVLTFIPRDTYYAATSSITFGEDFTGGEIPYLPDVSAGTDITYIYNNVTVTGSTGNAQNVRDSISQQRYNNRTLPVTTMHAVDADALLLAQHLLRIYKQPHGRVVALSLDPAANPDIWATALGVKFGDRVTFRRRTSAGVTIEFDAFVDRVQHDIGPGSWIVRLQISPVDPDPSFILGDATYGVLGQGVIKY